VVGNRYDGKGLWVAEPKLMTDAALAFADLWYETRAATGAALPSKNDFPLRSLQPFMSRLALIRFDAHRIARYTLFGTRLVTDFGADMTGEIVHEAMDPESLETLFSDLGRFFGEHGMDAPYGRWVSGQAQAATGRKVEYESLSLPYIEPSDQSVRLMMFALPASDIGFDEVFHVGIHEIRSQIFLATSPRPDWMFLDPARPRLAENV
jgi:PAS domain